jgi:hypothetical protein
MPTQMVDTLFKLAQLVMSHGYKEEKKNNTF